jgi:hypothetical protein
MMKRNFKKEQINIKLYQYYDEENTISLTIFKSGWKNIYQCIEEDPIFGTIIRTYSPEDIMSEYGINTFLRKQKLNTIDDSKL